MVDRFGTPYTKALHVVERYRLIDPRPRRQRSRSRRRNGRASAVSTPITGARACNSNLRWMMTAFSPCRGRRPSPMAATPIPIGTNGFAPKMSSTTIREPTSPTRTRICRQRTSRISDRAQRSTTQRVRIPSVRSPHERSDMREGRPGCRDQEVAHPGYGADLHVPGAAKNGRQRRLPVRPTRFRSENGVIERVHVWHDVLLDLRYSSLPQLYRYLRMPMVGALLTIVEAS